MQKLLILLSVIMASCSTASDPNCKNFIKWYQNKYESGQAFDTTNAIASISRSIRTNPGCIDALQTRARLFLLTDKIDSAKTDYKKILSIKREDLLALYYIGLVYKDQDQYDSSIYYLRKALAPKLKDSIKIVFNDMLTKSDAVKINYDISKEEIMYQLGLAYYYSHDRSSARKCFKYCSDTKYLPGQAHFYLGAIAIEENQKQEACDHFNKAKFYGHPEALEYRLKYCK